MGNQYENINFLTIKSVRMMALFVFNTLLNSSSDNDTFTDGN